MKRFIRSLAAAVLALTMVLSPASALTVEQAIGLLELNYIRDLPAEVYEAETVDQVFELLGDPYSYHMSAAEYKAFLAAVESTESLVGIGVSIQYTEEGILVVEVLAGGPAREAGLQAGDLIVAVDGRSCVPANESHRDMILGEEGSEVAITVLRDGAASNYTLKRARVVILNTTTEVLDDRIGYIECISFGSDTGALFREGVETYDESVDCWLVDVRGNGGGYSNAAVEAVGVFAGPGYHLYLESGQGMLYYYSYADSASTDELAVVLVDGGTASAAEAFSASMRDLRSGLLIGSRTYGKGTAQIVLDKNTDPELFAEDAVKLTAYQFYSNAGTAVNRIGVIPTLLVDDAAAYDVAMAICGPADIPPEDTLLLDLDRWMITLDYTSMAPATLAALFEALPPSASLWIYENDRAVSVSAAEAAERLGVTYRSRWFNDTVGSLFAQEINTLATYGIVHGDGEGNFYPDRSLTRSEVCAMLAKAMGLEGSDSQYFTDVPEDSVYTPYINAMAEFGFVVGMGDGTFHPDQTVTQQEFYVMLARMARYLNLNFDFYAWEITDEQRVEAAALGFRSWACDSVVLMNLADALYTVSGEPAPSEPILREEAAASLCAVLIGVGILPG